MVPLKEGADVFADEVLDYGCCGLFHVHKFIWSIFLNVYQFVIDKPFDLSFVLLALPVSYLLLGLFMTGKLILVHLGI